MIYIIIASLFMLMAFFVAIVLLSSNLPSDIFEDWEDEIHDWPWDDDDDPDDKK